MPRSASSKLADRRLRLVGCLALLAACGATGCERPPRALAARLTTEPAAGLFDAEALAALAAPPGWGTASDDERASWRLRGLEPLAAETAGWRLRATRADVRLARTGELASERVAVIEAHVAGADGGTARLYWSGRRGRFDRAQSVAVPIAPGDGETLRFELAGHAGWRGTVRGLRLDLPVRPGAEIAFGGLRFLPPADPLARWRQRPWQLELAGVSRPALLVPPDAPYRSSVAVAGARTLRFAVGLLPGQGCPLAATVTAAGDGGERRLWTAELAPPAGETWREVEVDLAAPAAGELVLELASRRAGDCAAAAPAVAFSVPELLAAAGGGERPPNVVLISIDTLRADRLGVYGYRRPTTPRLDEWARRSAVVFEQAVAPAPWTLPSHVSMLTGTDALAHGVNYRLPAPPSLVLLAETLRAAGYHTVAWTGGSWLAPRYGLAQGFDVFHAWQEPDDWEGELARHAGAATRWLAGDPVEPFFLFFHTFEVHAPYRRREPYYSRLGGRAAPAQPAIYDRLLPPLAEEGFALRKQLVAGRDGEAALAAPEELAEAGVAYDAGLAYADERLGDLLAALAARGLGGRTLVLLTSDHGESLGEGGRVSHGYLDETNLRVPWLVALPGGAEAGRRVATQVSLTDLVPTTLDLLGLPVPGGLDGRSLAQLLRGRDAGPPPPAASYAGSSNLGLSLRLGGRRQYLLNDTPWAPLAGDERLLDLTADGALPLAPDAAPSELAILRREAARRLARGAGLRLRLWNGERVELGAALRGPCVHPVTVKVVSGRPGAVRWVRRQEAVLRLAPAEALELRFDSPVSPCLAVEGEPGGGLPPFSVTADPAAGGEILLALTGGAWTEVAAGAAPRTGLHLWLAGPADVVADDPAATDPALLDQLQALGYVE